MSEYKQDAPVPQHPNAQAIFDARRGPISELPELIWFSCSSVGWPMGAAEALTNRGVNPEAVPVILQWFMTPALVGGFSLVSMQ